MCSIKLDLFATEREHRMPEGSAIEWRKKNTDQVVMIFRPFRDGVWYTPLRESDIEKFGEMKFNLEFTWTISFSLKTFHIAIWIRNKIINHNCSCLSYHLRLVFLFIDKEVKQSAPSCSTLADNCLLKCSYTITVVCDTHTHNIIKTTQR